MTNNQTIDGVPRELLQSLAEYATDSISPVMRARATVARALLDAPVVERQEQKPSQVPVLRAMAANYRNGHSWDFLDGEAVSKAADEITALQSKVERLEYALKDAFAYKEAAEEKAHELQSTIAQLQGRIAELESARGEPVAWRFRVTTGSDWFTTTKQRVAELYQETDDGGEVEPLFTAPPAPVAVSLPERKSDSGREWDSHYAAEVEGWNACLDATAALNEKTKQ